MVVAVNEAPWPDDLEMIVATLRYKPDWSFSLGDVDRGQGSKGLTLSILIVTPDSYDHSSRRRVVHYMPVPPAAYDFRSWRRWVFNQIGLVEDHERAEFFELDGDKPYAPSHGPGNDPYMIREVGTDVDRRTSFRGEVATAECKSG